MLKINEIIKKYELKPRKYIRNNKVTFIETIDGKYSIKPKIKDNHNIYNYLKTRNFDYMPRILSDENDEYELTDYIESYNIPSEQKIMDLIDLVSLLHNKTTHYKEVTEDDYKEIYEDLTNNIEYLYTYYNDLITIIENKIYMSPCEYLIARNISTIFSSLNMAHKILEDWYKLVKEKKKQRQVVLHNNLELNHFIVNEKPYLISWDKTKIGIPIFDIYKLYLKHGLDLDFNEIFKRYEKNYPLFDEEKKLFFVLILTQPKIELTKTEYENTKTASKAIDFIYKTMTFISPYYSNERKENNPEK